MKTSSFQLPFETASGLLHLDSAFLIASVARQSKDCLTADVTGLDSRKVERVQNSLAHRPHRLPDHSKNVTT